MLPTCANFEIIIMSTSTKSKKCYWSSKASRFRDLRIRRSRCGDAQLEVSVTHSGSGTSPTVTPTPLVPQSELWADTPEMDSELDFDQSFTEHPSDRDYSQSPVKRPKWAIVPLKSKPSLHCTVLHV